MKEESYYNSKFFEKLEDGSLVSARKILPLVFDIIKPQTVIDVGCGVGYWLKVCKELGASEVLGIEGDYVKSDLLKIEENEFLSADLKTPLVLKKRYDLALSMEVGEHLPDASADIFVKSLVSASDIILFSAAIIGQQGTYHINEQMPEYWAKKFMQRGYIPVDYLRDKVWLDKEIEFWYRQNAILYIKSERLNEFPVLQNAAEHTNPELLLRIHPEKYFYYIREARQLSTVAGWLINKKNKLGWWIKSRGK